MEVGPQNHNWEGLLEPNFRMVVCMDALAKYSLARALQGLKPIFKG